MKRVFIFPTGPSRSGVDNYAWPARDIWVCVKQLGFRQINTIYHQDIVEKVLIASNVARYLEDDYAKARELARETVLALRAKHYGPEEWIDLIQTRLESPWKFDPERHNF